MPAETKGTQNAPETFAEQLRRLESMAEGDETWDLSDNDMAAIDAVLQSHHDLRAALKALRDVFGDDERRCACHTCAAIEAADEAIAKAKGATHA